MRRLRIMQRVLGKLIVVVVVLGLCIAYGMAASVPALADTIIGTCTIVSNPTSTTFTNCPGADLTGANLSGLDLSYANLTGANLTGANLTGANLTNANFSVANLTNAILTNANVTSTNFYNATFAGLSSGGLTGTPGTLPIGFLVVSGYLVGPNANLSGANLANAYLYGFVLSGANLTNANLTNVNLGSAHLDSANLNGANLTNANLGGATLTNANLSGATLTGVSSGGIIGVPAVLPTGWSLVNGYLIGPGAYLYNANLSGANLANANLTGANLANANLTGAILTGATLTGVTSGGITGTPAALPAGWSLVNGYLIGPGANLTGANLTGANLSGANLTGANLSGITQSCIVQSGSLPCTNLSGANLTGANLTNANLSCVINQGMNQVCVNLSGANLTNANLTTANLSCVNQAGDQVCTNLSGTTLSNADLTGATLAGVSSGSVVGAPAALPVNWRTVSGYLIGPGADLFNASLSGADLTNADLGEGAVGNRGIFSDLDNANLTNANLTNANFFLANMGNVVLTGANVTGTNFGQAYMAGVTSGGLVGTPAGFPDSNWVLVDGFLVGPYANAPGVNAAGHNFDFYTWSGINLAGANLSNTSLRYIQLTNANLTGINLSGAGFFDSLLGGSSMTSANLTNASLYNSDFSGTNLTNAILTGASVQQVNMGSSTLTGVVSGGLTGVPTTLPVGWSMVNGYLVGPGANLTGALLSGANLTNATLTNANLSGANLSGATLTGVTSGGIIGTPASLPAGWTLVNGYLIGPGANLTGANLSGADLTNANLTNAVLTGANLSGTNLTGATLTGVTSGGITGTPAALPTGWTLVNGYLIGPGMHLLTITADNQPMVYGQPLPAFTYSVSGLVNGDPPSVVTGVACTSTATSASAVGTYPITCSGGTAPSYYVLDHQPGTLTIGPAPLTVTADSKRADPGQPLPAFTYSVSGLVNGDPASVVSGVVCTTTATSTSGPGTYPITCSGGTATNYTLSYVPGTLTIGPAPATVAADNKTIVYGQPLPALTYTVLGLLNGDPQSVVSGVVCTTTATSTSAAGTYPITCSGGTATNYVLSYQPGTLTIAKAPVTVTADNKTIVYGQPLPAFTYSVSGLLNGDPASVITGVVCTSSATSTSPGGAYPITCSGGTATNYAPIYQPGTLLVSYNVSISAPLPNTVVRPGSTIAVRFQLTASNGQPLPNALAASLGCTVTVTFGNTGPVCATYNAKKVQVFQATITTPTTLTKGASYPITVQVTSGTFVIAAATVNVIAK